MTESDPLPLEVDVTTVDQMRKAGEAFVLLDVREENEYELARIDGSILIPLSEFPQRVDELEPQRDQRIIVHCHHGGRSLHVTQALRQHGFQRVQNMAGGIDQWSQQVDPNVPRY